jgi:phage N-6-adenine-methyltransferase
LRKDFLTWTHHSYVAHLDEEAQQALLQSAVEHDLSSRELLEAVREYEANLKRFSSTEEATDDDPPFANKQDKSLYRDYEEDINTGDELVEGPTGNYRLNGHTKQCETCNRMWVADLLYCPYCHISPEVRSYEASKAHVANNSGNNEWYTPVEYIDYATQVLGEIDLDPASSEIANRVVKAKKYYTSQDNSLTQNWVGKIWMNPPYSSDLIALFIDKLIHHYKNEDVREAIVLVNNATETQWFQYMASNAKCICFPRTRIRFWKPDGELGSPLQGQAILYFGENNNAFINAFQDFGFVGVINGI